MILIEIGIGDQQEFSKNISRNDCTNHKVMFNLNRKSFDPFFFRTFIFISLYDSGGNGGYVVILMLVADNGGRGGEKGVKLGVKKRNGMSGGGG